MDGSDTIDKNFNNALSNKCWFIIIFCESFRYSKANDDTVTLLI